MVQADLAIRFDVPAERLWGVINGAEIVPVLLESYAANVEIDASGAQPILITTLRGGEVIRERIDSVDHEEHSLKYRVLDAGPLPYANYRGEARVQPCGDKACVLSFQCSFIAVGLSEAEARDHWVEHNRDVAETLRRFLQR